MTQASNPVMKPARALGAGPLWAVLTGAVFVALTILLVFGVWSVATLGGVTEGLALLNGQQRSRRRPMVRLRSTSPRWAFYRSEEKIMAWKSVFRATASALCLGGSAASAILGLAILLLQLNGCAALNGACPKCSDCENGTVDLPTCAAPDIDNNCTASCDCVAKPGAPVGRACACLGQRISSNYVYLCRIP